LLREQRCPVASTLALASGIAGLPGLKRPTAPASWLLFRCIFSHGRSLNHYAIPVNLPQGSDIYALLVAIISASFGRLDGLAVTRKRPARKPFMK
jgi:hypothetical protein